MSMAKKNPHYETLVIGSNITGRLLFLNLKKQGKKVGLIETSHLDKGFQLNQLSEKKPFPEQLNYLPDTPLNQDNTLWLNEITEQNFQWEVEENEVITCESGSLIPFVGFGSRKFPTLDFASSFHNQKKLVSVSFYQKLIDLMAQDLDHPDYFQNSTVTSFETNEDGALDRVIINGNKVITAESFLFTESPKQLLDLLPEKILSKKTISKLSKEKQWTSVHLSFHHSEELEAQWDKLHLLLGTNKDSEPCLGQFFKGDSESSSIWQTLLPTELEDASQEVYTALKYMKKQIKRAYPQFFDSVLAEKISVQPNTYGTVDLTHKDLSPLTKIQNLHIASPLFYSQDHLSNSIQAARELYKIGE